MVRRNRNWLPPLLWGGLRFSHSHGWFFWSMRVGRCWVQSFSQNRTIHLTSLQTVLPCDELYPGLSFGIRGKPSLFGHREGEDVWRIRRPGAPEEVSCLVATERFAYEDVHMDV